jgi:hypothetical protein
MRRSREQCRRNGGGLRSKAKTARQFSIYRRGAIGGYIIGAAALIV